MLDNGQEIVTPSKISLTLKNIYENLFQKNIVKSISEIEKLLGDIHLSTISDENCTNCVAEFTEDNLLIALKSILNNKTPRNDGLSKEFYKT